MGKIVHPERRMRDEHPWNVYKTLQRLKVMAKLQGLDNPFFSPSDICNALYDNWGDLDIRQTLWVLEAKMNFPLRFLKAHFYVEEWMERPSSRYASPWDSPRGMDSWRSRDLLSDGTKAVLGPTYEALCRDQMDDKWGVWINRKTPDISKYLVDSE